jgi:hypothetical protein
MRACIREKEITALVERGGWPDAAAEELRGHAAACKGCGQALTLLLAFRRERAQAVGAARLEAPGVLWWRAQLRRRNAALEKIGRPLLGAQIFAVAVSLIAALAVLAFEADKGPGWRSWLEEMPRAVSLSSLHLEALLPATLPAGALWATVVVLLALVTGVIAWVAAEKH